MEAAENYGLEQIILHHSFKKMRGKTLRIPCKERTNLTGENGAGKTSALALVPAFYGEEPERIVVKTSDTDSFLDYYLPTLQSLVIFQYRREDGLCCAAMYRHSDGKICYRFVRGSAEETFFEPGVRDALAAGATALETFNAIEDRGFRVSRQLRTILDYRAILQRDQKLIRRRASEQKALRAEALEFGLGSPETTMSHIEKLTHVVLNKNRLMSSFKTMICQTMFEDIHLFSKPAAMNGEALVLDIRSLRAFTEEAPKIRECLKKDGERRALMERSERTIAQLMATIEVAKEEADEAHQTAEKLDFECSEAETAFRIERQARARDIDIRKVELDNRSKALDRLYTARDDYEAQQLPEKKKAQENLPELRGQFKAAREDYEALTSKIEQFRSEHESALQVLQQEHERTQADRQANLVAAKTELNNARVRYETDLKTRDHECKQAELTFRHERGPEAQVLNTEVARLETRLESQAPTEAEQRSIREARVRHDEAVRAEDAVKQELAESANKCQLAKEERDQAQRLFGEADQHLEQLRAVREGLMHQLNPANGTWLHLIRKLDPAWGERLGKVINPALLSRPDLAPEFDPSCAEETSLMGWRIDLDRIQVPEFAHNDEVIQARIDNLDSRIRVAQSDRDKAEKSALSLQETLRTRELELEAIGIRLRGHELAARTAHTNLSDIESRVQQAIDQRKVADEKALDEKRKAIQAFELHTIEEIQRIADSFAQQKTDRMGLWADEQQQLEDNIDNLKQLKDQAQSEFEARKQRKVDVYTQLCQKEGLDPDVIKAADLKQKQLRDQIAAIENEMDAVEGYTRWLANEWSRVPTLGKEITEIDEEYRRLTSEDKAFETAFSKTMQSTRNKAAEARARERSLRAELEKALLVLEKFPSARNALPGMPGDLVNLTRELGDTFQGLVTLKKSVIAAFRSAKRVINQYEGTQISNAWTKQHAHRIAMSSSADYELSEAFELDQVADLRILMDTDIPQLESTLTENFRTEAGRLCNYFDGLENLSREVKTVSATLGKKINTEQRIESLEDIRIVLTPRIYEDDSWDPLKRFDQGWKDWSSLNRRTLPTDDILRSFCLVHDTLKSANIGTDMESLVDMHIAMRIDGRPITIRRDHDFTSASSTGLSYLAIIVTFMGMTRYLCPDRKTRITWPVDELGTLSDNNIARLAAMLDENNLTLISACPKLDRGLMKFFENKLRLDQGEIVSFAQNNSSERRAAMKQRVSAAMSQPEAPSHVE